MHTSVTCREKPAMKVRTKRGTVGEHSDSKKLAVRKQVTLSLCFFIGSKNRLIPERFFFDLCKGNAFGLLMFFHEFPIEQKRIKQAINVAPQRQEYTS